MNQITTMVWSFTQSQTLWSAKSSRPQETLLLIKIVDVIEFQQSYFKTQKMMPSRCCIQHVSKSGRPSSSHRTGKGQSSSNSQEGSTKECANYQTIVLISHAKPVCRSRNKSQNQIWKMDWFKIRKGVHQGYILSPCLFNLNAEYIMQNAKLDEAQGGTTISGRNINNLR